jgi:hypothetical protein
VEDIAPSDPRNALRLRYLDFLRDLTGRYPVDVICEETKHGEESIAETIADREELRFRNIEVPMQRRAELGIALVYTSDVRGTGCCGGTKGQMDRIARILYGR